MLSFMELIKGKRKGDLNYEKQVRFEEVVMDVVCRTVCSDGVNYNRM